jgi:hypothetical protein
MPAAGYPRAIAAARTARLDVGLLFATCSLQPGRSPLLFLNGSIDMRVSIYNDGDNSIRVIADRNAGNETMIDAGEEVVVEAESVVHLLEIDDRNNKSSVEDDEHEEDHEP